jgi:hypothetical protein
MDEIKLHKYDNVLKTIECAANLLQEYSSIDPNVLMNDENVLHTIIRMAGFSIDILNYIEQVDPLKKQDSWDLILNPLRR